MEFQNLIKNRFSVRSFKNTAIEPAKINMILEAGRLAPSAVNFQPWHFIVVQQTENLKKIKAIYPREWITSAPVLIIACSDHSKSWKRRLDGKDSADIDISIAVDHMTLQAVEIGLGTCWVCNFDAKKCSELFNIPEHIEPVVILPLGYPDISAPEKKRKPLEEITHWETF
ncbi:nitroreductase [Maribellus comscasis]|uniref:Nitroreductase n=1 Tax=Maribellus comscasis TaxID=2681766 RepID=A0A6I6K3H7_9BACT|nr:nitroreductase family protein [Maribellus comscasis]QGY47127.1 nitroreductase [Maribellus comscasis]